MPTIQHEKVRVLDEDDEDDENDNELDKSELAKLNNESSFFLTEGNNASSVLTNKKLTN
jgi:hypothetical protein